MKPKYEIGNRVSFMGRTKCSFNGKIITGLTRHYVGYIKAVRRSLFRTRYVINVAKSDEIFICKPSEIFGLVKKREESNKSETE